MSGGGDTTKTASASDPHYDMVKEANSAADALEFLSLQAAQDGTPAGAAKADLLQTFFKESAAARPAETSTDVRGTQGHAPSQGKNRIQPTGLKGGARPEVHEAPEGAMSINTQEQPAPAKAPTPTEGAKKAGADTTLFGILMDKHAGSAGGPKEYEAGQAPPARSHNENSNVKAILEGNDKPAKATKRDAKAPTRARLKELFRTADDTTSDQAAAAIWPNAARKGKVKIASALPGAPNPMKDAVDSAKANAAPAAKGLRGLKNKIFGKKKQPEAGA